MRSDADDGALRWGMLAWEDPYAERPMAPFWAEAGVVEGLVTHDMPPLVRLAAEGGAALSGLRLDDATLGEAAERVARAVERKLSRGGKDGR